MFTFNKLVTSIAVVNVGLFIHIDITKVLSLILKFANQKIEKDIRKSSGQFLKFLIEKLTGRT